LDNVMRWLTDDSQPAVKYLAMRDLLEADAGELAEAQEGIASQGWVKDILSSQLPQGLWASPETLYVPKYKSTNWMLLVLADLGVTKEAPQVRKAAEIWMRRFAKADGGFGMDGSKTSHLCVVGNTARALVLFGYEDHAPVKKSFEWMASHASHLGGWSCFGSGRNLDSWEPLSAFAVYPRQKWSRSMKDAVEKGAEFYLERELHIQGDHYEPWYRFHYPVHYYYDLLVGLDLLTSLGYGGDPRLRHALDHLKRKRRPDGRWNLDAIHPDVEGNMAEWYAKHPKKVPVPLALEEVGKPSRIVTLRALKVLKRVEAQRGAT